MVFHIHIAIHLFIHIVILFIHFVTNIFFSKDLVFLFVSFSLIANVCI